MVENALEGNGNYFTVMFFAEHLTYFVIVCKIILTPPVFPGKERKEEKRRGEAVQRYISRNYETFYILRASRTFLRKVNRISTCGYVRPQRSSF